MPVQFFCTWRQNLSLLILAMVFPRAAALAASDESVSFERALTEAREKSLDTKRGQVAIDLAAIDVSLAEFDDDFKLTLGGIVNAGYAQPGAVAPGATSGPKPASTAGTPHAAAKELPGPVTEVPANIETRPLAGENQVDRSNQDDFAGGPIKDFLFSKTQTYTLSWSRTLYDFGRTSSRHEQLVTLKDVKTLAMNEIDEVLSYKVARAYVGLIAAERLVKLSRDQTKLAQGKLAEQKSNYQKGLRPESDVVTAEVEVGRAKVAEEKSLDDARAARLSLAQLMGRADIGASSLSAPEAALRLKDPHDMTPLLARWVQPAPSATMKRRAKEREATNFDQNALDAAKRPTLNGAISFQESSPIQEKTKFKPSLSGQIAFAWDLPWHGQGREETRKISLRNQDSTLQDDFDLKARADKDKLGRDAVAAATRQWEALSKQLALVEKQRNLTKRRYESGKASALELGQTETDLVNAHGDLTKLSGALQLSVIDVAEAHSAPPAELSALFR